MDVGAWAMLVLGVDGGHGSHDLCRPLQARPAAFGVDRGTERVVALHIVLTIPDEDVSQVAADVQVTSESALPATAAPVVDSTVATLVEPLRGLGGESTATRVESRVRCTITSL